MNYEEIYKSLGISSAQMPGDYTPDRFAQWLMRDVPKQGNVKISTFTTPINNPSFNCNSIGSIGKQNCISK